MFKGLMDGSARKTAPGGERQRTGLHLLRKQLGSGESSARFYLLAAGPLAMVRRRVLKLTKAVDPLRTLADAAMKSLSK